MAANYNDKQVLGENSIFHHRVRQALLSACVAVKSEDPRWVPFHREREIFAIQCMNSPGIYEVLFGYSIANDAHVIADATEKGTITLTASNVNIQQALITDAHIDSAVSSHFNAFFRTPA